MSFEFRKTPAMWTDVFFANVFIGRIEDHDDHPGAFAAFYIRITDPEGEYRQDIVPCETNDQLFPFVNEIEAAKALLIWSDDQNTTHLPDRIHKG